MAATYLLDGLKVVLHALDGHVFACLDALRFEHLGEGALALLTDETVLLHFVANLIMGA